MPSFRESTRFCISSQSTPGADKKNQDHYIHALGLYPQVSHLFSGSNWRKNAYSERNASHSNNFIWSYKQCCFSPPPPPPPPPPPLPPPPPPYLKVLVHLAKVHDWEQIHKLVQNLSLAPFPSQEYLGTHFLPVSRSVSNFQRTYFAVLSHKDCGAYTLIVVISVLGCTSCTVHTRIAGARTLLMEHWHAVVS